jgi:hypothetical protein
MVAGRGRPGNKFWRPFYISGLHKRIPSKFFIPKTGLVFVMRERQKDWGHENESANDTN